MIDFKVRLKPVGLLSVGWVYPLRIDADVPFMRKGVKSSEGITYRCYIPGSSFKGALRSSASRIADLFGFKSCGEVNVEYIRKAHGKIGLCDVCKLFGYPGSSEQGLLYVADFDLVNDVATLTSTGIRVDDSSCKVAEGALFTVEKIPRNAEFLGRVSLATHDVKLIELTLLALANLRLDRIGRRSQLDLKLEDTKLLETFLKEPHWMEFLNEMKEWLYHEVL
ncbi:hypothetical protein KEJ27_09235 [Candidatus Bathyarchaeota archaeon]|nr:hypothetical protein [Candidatus Bathyarchaeota archaeon]